MSDLSLGEKVVWALTLSLIGVGFINYFVCGEYTLRTRGCRVGRCSEICYHPLFYWMVGLTFITPTLVVVVYEKIREKK